MNKELIEERLHYLVENFELIQTLVEREKARPKSVFGWKAGGVFNETKEDILWGSDAPKKEVEQVTEEEVKSIHTSKGADLDSPSVVTKKEIVKDNPWHKIKTKQSPTTDKVESKVQQDKDNTDDRINTNTINSTTPDISIRESAHRQESRDNTTATEDRRTATDNSKTKEPVKQEQGGAKKQVTPTSKIKAPKKIEQPFNSRTPDDTIKKKTITIDHQKIAETEYEAACKKKGIDYVSSEERHKRAKEGANKIRNRSKDSRKLW